MKGWHSHVVGSMDSQLGKGNGLTHLQVAQPVVTFGPLTLRLLTFCWTDMADEVDNLVED